MAKAPGTPPPPPGPDLTPDVVEKTKQVEATSDAKKTVATEETKRKTMDTSEAKAQRTAENKKTKDAASQRLKGEQEQANELIDEQTSELRNVISHILSTGQSALPEVAKTLLALGVDIRNLSVSEIGSLEFRILASTTKPKGPILSDLKTRVTNIDEFLSDVGVIGKQSADIRRRLAKVLSSSLARLKPAVAYKSPEELAEPIKIAAEREVARKVEAAKKEQDRLDKLESDKHAHKGQLDDIQDGKDAHEKKKEVEKEQKKAEKEMKDTWKEWWGKVGEARVKNMKGEGDNLNPLTWPVKIWRNKKKAFVATVKGAIVVPAKFIYERKLGIAVGMGIGSLFPGLGLGTALGGVVGSLIPPKTFSKKS